MSFNGSVPMYNENFPADVELLEEFKRYEKAANVPLALEILFRWSQIDGAHHKDYAIDQILRALTGTEENYEEFVKDFQGEYDEYEDEYDYPWSKGIAP